MKETIVGIVQTYAVRAFVLLQTLYFWTLYTTVNELEALKNNSENNSQFNEIV